MTSRDSLQRLFAPRSVAVVGASASPEKAGYQALLALGDFAGDVFPINPKADAILGRRTFPSLGALGRPVDLVLFAVPAPACVGAVREAIRCGCGGGLVVSAGFAEAGASGAAIQAELAALCAEAEFRLLGPNTAGFVNTERSLTASFLLSARQIPRGEVAVVAQSAGITLTVGFLLAKLGYGVSCAVGLGNAVDVGAADVLEFLAEQPTTKAIALHLEGVPQGRRLFETLRRITPTKPVAVLLVGRQDVGEFALSHTGNMIGSYALRATAMRQAGAVVVESTDELAAATAALSLHRLPPKEQPGIGVLTAQAGPGLVMLDLLKSSGIAVPPLSEATTARIAEQLPAMTYVKNPVDTGRPGTSFASVLEALAADERIDAVIAYALNEPAALLPAEVLPGVARKVRKPILFGTMGPQSEIDPTMEALRRERIYTAESPEALARTVSALARDATLQARLSRAPEAAPGASSAVLAERGDEHAAKILCEGMGVPVPRRFACATHEEARRALRELGSPVVAKILAPEIAHKTEVDGVHLGILDEAGLNTALARLDAIPSIAVRRYLIEEMAAPGLELIVGAVRDASFGPTVMVGLGGVAAEALREAATRLAPLTLVDAEDMLDELRAAPLFEGVRGGGRLHRQAVAHTIVALGRLLCEYPQIAEFEINPLRVYPGGVLALDALLVMEPSPGHP
jgi:acetate---CoA ligase (ADP-forming)